MQLGGGHHSDDGLAWKPRCADEVWPDDAAMEEEEEEEEEEQEEREEAAQHAPPPACHSTLQPPAGLPLAGACPALPKCRLPLFSDLPSSSEPPSLLPCTTTHGRPLSSGCTAPADSAMATVSRAGSIPSSEGGGSLVITGSGTSGGCPGSGLKRPRRLFESDSKPPAGGSNPGSTCARGGRWLGGGRGRGGLIGEGCGEGGEATNTGMASRNSPGSLEAGQRWKRRLTLGSNEPCSRSVGSSSDAGHR